MRSDDVIGETLRKSEAWKSDPLTGHADEEVIRYALPNLERGKMSFSGKERNHLFLNDSGQAFQDVSAVAGVDAVQDSRSIAICDFNRDGWQDMMLVNTNSPVLMMFKNMIGARNASEPAKVVAFEFVGGNRFDTPSEQFGPRDGFGVRVRLKSGGQLQTREFRCGEGLAAQNSKRLLFGLGNDTEATDVEIVWPSGIKQNIPTVSAGDLITVFENVDESPEPKGFVVSQYLIDQADKAIAENPVPRVYAGATFQPVSEASAALNVYTSMATWCPSCKNHLPAIKKLKTSFDSSQVQLFAVPVDPEDTTQKLIDYIQKLKPEYRLLQNLSEENSVQFKSLLQAEFKSEALPMTVVTRKTGEVIAVLRGLPSVSDLARWLP